jgi:hypothetical protein
MPQGKIGDINDVAVNDSLAMLLQRAESAPQQAGIQLAIGSLRKNRHGWERPRMRRRTEQFPAKTDAKVSKRSRSDVARLGRLH